MSKKSTNRYDSEGDTDSTSYGRCTSSRSSHTSAKEDSQAGGDYGCNSSSTSSPQTVSYDWAKFTHLEHSVKRDMDDIDCDDVYMEKLTDLRNQLHLVNLSDAELEENSPSQSPVALAETSNYSRRYSSAPCYVNKKVSSNVCTLHRIEENDEISSTENQKGLNPPLDAKDDLIKVTNSDLNVHTPRCIEVPPKKKCVRAKTPDYDSFAQKTCPVDQFVENIRVCNFRKVTKCTKASVSTQISSTALSSPDNEVNVESLTLNLGNLNATDSDCSRSITVSDSTRRSDVQPVNSRNYYSQTSSYSSSKGSRFLSKQVEVNFTGDNDDSSIDNSACNLPSSVMEDVCPKYLEPNIVVLDSVDKKKRKKRRQEQNMGDISTSSENFLLTQLNAANYLRRHKLECRPRTPRRNVSRKYHYVTYDMSNSTPTCVMSVITDDIKPSSSRRSTSDPNWSTENFTNRIYSQTELEEQELRTIEPVRSCDANFNDNAEHASEFDVKSIKSLIENFAEGVQPTRSFPADFEDVQNIAENDHGDAISNFKERASDLLFAKSFSCNFKKRSEITHANTMKKDKYSECSNLVDIRREQSTDIDYYMVPSPSTSDDDSEHIAGLNASEIYVGENTLNRCWCCFPCSD